MEFIGYDLILSLVTLTLIEIILGIDNLIFISLITYKLSKKLRSTARIFGLSLALIIRIIMLTTLTWIMTLTDPLFYIGSMGFAWKNFLLIFGGLFLLIKSGKEIFHDVYFREEKTKKKEEGSAHKTFLSVIVQITLIDFVFSFDSVITAVAMTNNIPIMIAAIVISMIVMLLSFETINKFLHDYPSLKIVALAFIFMVGVILLADGFDIHIEKSYLYFSLFFTITIEILNIISRKRHS